MPSNNLTFLLIHLGDELYGLPGGAVREIIRWRTPTPVPGAPPVLLGIIGQRGVVLPVIDMRILLGMPPASPDRATRLVVAHNEEAEVALLVDRVSDLVTLAAAALDPPPAALDIQRARLLRGVARLDDQPLAMIDMAGLIAAVRTG